MTSLLHKEDERIMYSKRVYKPSYHRLGLILSDQKKTYHDEHLIMDHLSFKCLHVETIIYEIVRHLVHRLELSTNKVQINVFRFQQGKLNSGSHSKYYMSCFNSVTKISQLHHFKIHI